MQSAIDQALAIGFSHVGALNPATLTPLKAVRDMCSADRCGLYGRCWTCPPGCGSIEENKRALQGYTQGIIVQTTRTLEDDFDLEGIEGCGAAHRDMFIRLAAALRAEHSDLLALGAGGCRLCEECTYPDAPCRRPGEALSSMEAYGLLVSDVCTQNGLAYYYGPQTITYTGCYVFDRG